MKSYQETLTAGQAVTLAIGGRVFYLKESSGGEVVSVELVRNYAESNKIERVGKGLRILPAAPFDGVKFTATANTVIEFIITDGDVDVAFTDDEIIVGNVDANAVPVRTPVGQPLEVLFAGTVEPVFGIATVDNTNEEAIPVKKQSLSTIVHQAAVAVGVAATALVSDATLRKLVIRNDHATAKVALGGAGVTLANGAIVLLPGDMWMEDDAPGAAWYAISDTAATNVQVTGIK